MQYNVADSGAPQLQLGAPVRGFCQQRLIFGTADLTLLSIRASVMISSLIAIEDKRPQKPFSSSTVHWRQNCCRLTNANEPSLKGGSHQAVSEIPSFPQGGMHIAREACISNQHGSCFCSVPNVGFLAYSAAGMPSATIQRASAMNSFLPSSSSRYTLQK